MRVLVTADTVKKHAETGEKTMEIPADAIITPSAKDLAGDLGIKFSTHNQTHAPVLPGKVFDEGLVQKIVQAVLAELQPAVNPGFVKEADPSGLRLVRGQTVKLNPFNTGNPQDRVGIKEILTTKESPHLATGFMTMEQCSFPWELKYEEIDYIVEGTLELVINGVTYRGGPGDVFYIPANTKLTFKCPDRVKFFFVTHPANWAELSGYQK